MMPSFYALFGLLKKLALFIIIVAIAIPLRYGSTNRQYLQLRLLHSILSLKYSLVPDPARPTLSADYRAFENILRMKPIAEQDPLEDPTIIVQKIRSTFNMGTIIPKPSQCQIHKEVFEHDGHLVDTYWVDYPTRKFQPKFDKLLIYLHGGAYMLGDIHSE
jgi:acetyl esterase/lipase